MTSYNRKRGVRRFTDTGLGTGGVDPFQSDVTLVMLYQGLDGDGGGIAELTGGHTPTLVNSPTTVTATKSLGISSMSLTAASSQCLTIPNSSDFYTTANGLTVDGIIRRNGTPASSNFYTFAELRDSSVTRAWAIYVNENGQIGVILSAASNADISIATTNRGAIADTTFTHVALVHDPGVEYRVYVGGSLTATISDTTAIADGDGLLEIGRDTGSYFYWNGHIQALRITQNVRYSGSVIDVPDLGDYFNSIAA